MLRRNYGITNLRHGVRGVRGRSRGLSIVELMIGMTIGLFLISGASIMFINNIQNSRLLLLQTRLDQDLRATMDLITRDLRRGAYWVNSLSGTTTTGSAAASNPYNAVAVAGTSSAPSITYKYANTADDSAGTVNTRTFGFRLEPTSGGIQMDIGGGNWQPLTDTNIVTVSAFTITPTTTAIDISGSCASTCVGATCPSVTVRKYSIALTGTSKIDANVSRTLRSEVRVRNDALAGTCPA